MKPSKPVKMHALPADIRPKLRNTGLFIEPSMELTIDCIELVISLGACHSSLP
ncbi:hypothetical protein D3C71_804530 [compost metagenome]